jgi:small ubiquitin-related modifier
VFFKIKRATPLKKLMETYCERQGKSMNSVRFLVDGERVRTDQSPQDLDLEDGDVIEVMMYGLFLFANCIVLTTYSEQTGGQ